LPDLIGFVLLEGCLAPGNSFDLGVEVVQLTASLENFHIDGLYFWSLIEISLVNLSHLDPVVLDSQFSELGLVLVRVPLVVFLLLLGVNSGPSLGTFLLVTHRNVLRNVLLVLCLEVAFDSDELRVFFAQCYCGQIA
jgi:hypothetical protein